MALKYSASRAAFPVTPMEEIIKQEILPVLPLNIRQIMLMLPVKALNQLEEIRLREGRPLIVSLSAGDTFLSEAGQLANSVYEAYRVTSDDIEKTLHLISKSSIYALEEELKKGFITLRGGHRVGITGKTVLDRGQVRTMKYFSGFNIRVAREVTGAADKVAKYLIDPIHHEFYHTLIISPPQCGKTTLLRDIIRQLSDGIETCSFPGVNVGVVDERSEIAGCYHGVPQKDIGIRTDVLDSCPKAEGMIMLIRAMSPRVIATDEIGREEDITALGEALNAGIKVLTTVHGRDLQELTQRPLFRNLMQQQIFERYVILSRTRGAGTLEDVIDGKTFKSLKR